MQQSDDLVSQIRSEYHDPAPPVTAAQNDPNAPLKAIASVTAIAHTYSIELAGIEKIGGADCYHLVMHPAREPQRFRLRDLWIDTQSYQTRQLLVASNFTSSHVPWLVTFADIGNAHYIASEVAQAPVGVGPHRYEHASITFEGRPHAAAGHAVRHLRNVGSRHDRTENLSGNIAAASRKRAARTLRACSIYPHL